MLSLHACNYLQNQRRYTTYTHTHTHMQAVMLIHK
jgi:hypothetical protein